MNEITAYIYTEEQSIQALFLEASWVEELSSGFGQSYFGLDGFGF